MTDILAQTFVWMKEVRPINSEKSFSMLGHLANRSGTLVVVEQDGTGGAHLYCQTHNMVYSIKRDDVCPGCRDGVANAPKAAPVTARNTR
jgi:hypothetical protein